MSNWRGQAVEEHLVFRLKEKKITIAEHLIKILFTTPYTQSTLSPDFIS